MLKIVTFTDNKFAFNGNEGLCGKTIRPRGKINWMDFSDNPLLYNCLINCVFMEILLCQFFGTDQKIIYIYLKLSEMP